MKLQMAERQQVRASVQVAWENVQEILPLMLRCNKGTFGCKSFELLLRKRR